MKTPTRLPELPLFAALWLACAWFHPGGGWNQNARFAQVRAIVEEGRLAIDDFLVYAPGPPAGADLELVRVPVVGGEIEVDGRRAALAWSDADDRLVPVDGRERPGAPLAPLVHFAASGDVSFAGGHFYPNKAPGTTLAAVPAYFVLFHLERLAGWNPDRWWVMTVNAWLTSALSVGLLTALTGLAVYRLALRLAPGPRGPRLALATAVTWGLGTMAWPYGTMLHEHAPAAAGLAAALLLLTAAREREEARGEETESPTGGGSATWVLVAAGAAAGFAAVASYAAVVPAGLLGLHAAVRLRRRSGALAFAAGLGLVAGTALVYHAVCFGDPFSTAYQHQNPDFRGPAGAFLGVFDGPRLSRLAAILVSPFRGLFVTSPVLVLAVAGLLIVLVRRRIGGAETTGFPREARPIASISAAVFLFFLAFNISFNGWFGGWEVGPRYLVPALPFLALPLAVAFRRWPRTTAALAVVSIALQGLVVAVDPQAPVGVTRFASMPGRAIFWQDPVGHWELPLFSTGKPGPFLAARPEAAPALAFFEGPVSAQPIGVYEAGLGLAGPAGSRQARWNSFNAGELLFGRSRWSLVPLAAALAALLAWAAARARREGSFSPDG